MSFLIDAQLPQSFCDWLRNNGHDALHTFDLDLGNRTQDSEIISIADREGRVVVTKDHDSMSDYDMVKSEEVELLANCQLSCFHSAALISLPTNLPPVLRKSTVVC